MLLHLGVARLAAGQLKEGLSALDKGEALGREGPHSMAVALLYNRALQLSAAKDRTSREKAALLLESFLRQFDPWSAWWELAHERYLLVCEALGRKVLAREELRRVSIRPLQPPARVYLASGREITVGAEAEQVGNDFGPGRAVTVVRGMNLVRLKLEKHPLELLVTERVLAICLVGADAPPLLLRGKGVGTGRAAELRIGMGVKDVDALLGDDYHPCVLTVLGSSCRFYPDRGVAVRLLKGVVTELIVVQVPQR